MTTTTDTLNCTDCTEPITEDNTGCYHQDRCGDCAATVTCGDCADERAEQRAEALGW